MSKVEHVYFVTWRDDTMDPDDNQCHALSVTDDTPHALQVAEALAQGLRDYDDGDVFSDVELTFVSRKEDRLEF